LTLAGAARRHVDWLEIDVCHTADGTLVLRHDLELPSHRRIREMTLQGLRGADPDVLTLDEAAEVLGGSAVPTLVDLKDPGDAEAVATWLAQRSDPERWAICTDDLPALRVAQDRAPAVQRWRGLPHIAPGRGEGARRIAACALRTTLPARVPRLVAEAGATALSVDRWAVTPRLCAAAHAMRVEVAAWTVNTERVAQRMSACGVDFITTDRPDEMRAALASQDGSATARCDG
jgi:glycerophosphoryl diester phosphodiesterase